MENNTSQADTAVVDDPGYAGYTRFELELEVRTLIVAIPTM